MAFDDFNRADQSPIAGDWAAAGLPGQMRLVSNAVATVTALTDSASRFPGSIRTFSQVKITTLGTGDGGPGIHLSSTGNGYVTSITGGNLNLLRWDAGTPVALGAIGISWALNDVAAIRRVGDKIIVSRNGVDVFSLTDNTHLTGNPGIYAFDATIRFDDWTDVQPIRSGSVSSLSLDIHGEDEGRFNELDVRNWY